MNQGMLRLRDIAIFKLVYFFFFFFKFIILRGRENTQVRKGRDRERGREKRIPSRLHTIGAELDVGLDLTNLEIMTWAKIKSQTLGAPRWLSRLSVQLQLRS